MFTSRAEYRILLRQDDADRRLTPRSYELGLASEERMRKVERKGEQISELVAFIKSSSATPQQVNPLFKELGTPEINQKTKLSQLLLRPQISFAQMKDCCAELATAASKADQDIREEVCEGAEILVKYESYINKEQEIVERLSKYENFKIKDDFDYSQIKALSFEAREKLNKVRPATIGQAGRISGVSPADVSVLIIYLAR
jgi:tRNA uridine 5-carboxymethylaminomethyl modification enzyme